MSTVTENEVSRGAMSSDEMDLKLVQYVLLKYKQLILRSIAVVVILATGISFLMPNIYHAEILISPVQAENSKSALGSALGSMGGLASVAGVSLGGAGSAAENLAVLKSREFLWQFAQKNNLMPILFEDSWDAQKKRWKNDNPKKQPGQWHVYRLLIKKGMLDVSVDRKTEIVTVAVEWEDPALAAKWANDLIEQLNQYLAKQTIARSERNLKYLNEELAHTQVEEMRKALFDLIASEQKNAMMANTQKEFAFKVLDPAAEPDKKIKPKRLILVIFSALLAGFIASLYAFIKEAMIKRKESDTTDKTPNESH